MLLMKHRPPRSLGTFIGPFSSTFLAFLPQEGWFNELNSAGWAIAFVNVAGVLLCLLCLDNTPPTKTIASNDIEQNIEQNKPPDTPLWKNLVVWICLLFQLITALLLAVLEVVPPVVLTTHFQMPPAASSLLFGVASLLVLGIFAATAAVGSRMSRRSLMMVRWFFWRGGYRRHFSWLLKNIYNNIVRVFLFNG